MPFKNTLLITAIFSILLLSCSTDQDGYDSLAGPAIESEHLFDIRENGNVLFSRLTDIKVADDGKLFIADPGNQQVYLFDENGEFLEAPITEGRGPGEMQMMAERISLSANNNLLLFSQILRRFSQFSYENGRLTHVADLPLEIYPNRFHLTPDNEIIIYETNTNREGEERIDRLHRFNMQGEMIDDSFLTIKTGENLSVRANNGQTLMTISSENHPKNLIAFHDDRFISARSETIHTRIFDLTDSEILQEFSLNRPNRPFPTDEKREFLDGIVGALGLGSEETGNLMNQMPEFKNIVSSLLYDPAGTIWMRLSSDDDPRWVLFSESGEIVGNYDPGFEGNVLAVNNNRLYVQSETEEGELYISVHQIASEIQ